MYQSKLSSPETDRFFSAVLSLESVEDCYRFFDDVATISEIQAMVQRLHVARLLNDGQTYAEVAEATGASTATISRVSRCLTYGADGYKTVLSRIDAK